MEIQRELNKSTYEWTEQYQQSHVGVVAERTLQKNNTFSLRVDSKKNGETYATSGTSMASSSSSSDVDDNCFYYGPEKRANTVYDRTKKNGELLNVSLPFLTKSLTSLLPTNISSSSATSDSPDTSSDELIYNRTRSNDNCTPSRITRKKKTALIKAFGWRWKKTVNRKMKHVKGDKMLREQYKPSTSFCKQNTRTEPLTSNELSENEYVNQNTTDGFDETNEDFSTTLSEEEFMVIPPAGSPTVSILSQGSNNNDNNIGSSAVQINSSITNLKRRKVLPLLIVKKRKSQCENAVSNIPAVLLNSVNLRKNDNNMNLIKNTSLSNTVVSQELRKPNYLKRRSELLEIFNLKRSKGDCESSVVPVNDNHNIKTSELNESNNSGDSENFFGFTQFDQAFSLNIHTEVVANLKVQKMHTNFRKIEKPIQINSHIGDNIGIYEQQKLSEMFPRLAPYQKPCNKILSIDYDVRYIELLNDPIFHPLYLKDRLKITYNNLKHNHHLIELKEIPEKYTKQFSLIEYFSSHRILHDPIKRVLLLVERFSEVILHVERNKINCSEYYRLRLYITTKTRKDCLSNANNVIKIIPENKFHVIDEAYILKVTLDEKNLLKALVPTFIKLEDRLSISDSENQINWDDKDSVFSFASVETSSTNTEIINNIYDIENNEENYEYNPEIFKPPRANIIDVMLPPDNSILETDSETSCERLKNTAEEENAIELQNKSKVAKHLEDKATSTEIPDLIVPPHDSTTKIILDAIVESEALKLSAYILEDTNAPEIMERPENHARFPGKYNTKTVFETTEVLEQSQTASGITNASVNLERFANNETDPENSNVTVSQHKLIIKPELKIKPKQEVFESLHNSLQVTNLPEISEYLENKSTAPENVNVSQKDSTTKEILQTIDDSEVLEHLQNTSTITELIERIQNISIPREITVNLTNHDSNLEMKTEEHTVTTLHSNEISETVANKPGLNMICMKPSDVIVLSAQKTIFILNRILESINKIASILIEHDYCVNIVEGVNKENYRATFLNSIVCDESNKIKSVLEITLNDSFNPTIVESSNINKNYSNNGVLKIDFTYLLKRWQKFYKFQITPEMVEVFQMILFGSQTVIRRRQYENTLNYEISFRKRVSDKSDKAAKHVSEDKNYIQTDKEELLKYVDENSELGKANEEIYVINESLDIVEDTCREKIFDPIDPQSKISDTDKSEDLIESDTGNEIELLFESDSGNNDVSHTPEEIKNIVTENNELVLEDVEPNIITNVSKQIKAIEEIDMDKEINIVEDNLPKIKGMCDDNELLEDGFKYVDTKNKSKIIDVSAINRHSEKQIELINDSQTKIKNFTITDVSKTIVKETTADINNEIYENNSSSTEIAEDLYLLKNGSASECYPKEEITKIFVPKYKDNFRTLLKVTFDMISKWSADLNMKLKLLTTNSRVNNKKVKEFNPVNEFYTQNAVFIVQNFDADITKILDVCLTLIQSHTVKNRISALVITFNYIYVQLIYNNSKHIEQFYISILPGEKYKIYEISKDMKQYRKKVVPTNHSKLCEFIQNCKEQSVQKYIDLPPQISADLLDVKRFIFEENKFSEVRNRIKDDDEFIDLPTEDEMNEPIYIEDDEITINLTAPEENMAVKEKNINTNDNKNEYLYNYDSVIDQIKNWASNITNDLPSVSSGNTFELNQNIRKFVEIVLSDMQLKNSSDSCIKNGNYYESSNKDNYTNLKQNTDLQKQAKLNNLIPLQQCYNREIIKKIKSYQHVFFYMHKYIMMSRMMMTINQNQIYKFLLRPIYENNVTHKVYEIEVRKGNEVKVFLYKVDKSDKILDIGNNDEKSTEDNIEQHNFKLETHHLGNPLLNNTEKNKTPTTENDLRIEHIVSAEENMDVEKEKEILCMHEEIMRMEEINWFTEKHVDETEEDLEEVNKNVADKYENIENMNIKKNSIDDDDDSRKFMIDTDAENREEEENINEEDKNNVTENLNTQNFQNKEILNLNVIMQSLHKLETETNNKMEKNPSERLPNSIGESLTQNEQSRETNNNNIKKSIPKISILSVEILKPSKTLSFLSFCRKTVIVRNTNSVNDISSKATVSKFSSQNTSTDKNEILNTSKNIMQTFPKCVETLNIEKPVIEDLNIASYRTPIIDKSIIQKISYNNLLHKAIHKSTLGIDESKNELDLICDTNKMIDQITTKTGLLTITRIPKNYESNIQQLNIATPLNKDINNTNFCGSEKTNNRNIKQKRSLNELIDVLVNKAIKSLEHVSNNNPSSSRNNNSDENKIFHVPHSIRNILNLDTNDERIGDNSKLGTENNCANGVRGELVKIDEKSNKHIDKKSKNLTSSFKPQGKEGTEKVYVKNNKEFEENLRILQENNAKQIFIFYWFIRNLRDLKKEPMYDLITFFKMLKNGELKYYKTHFENYYKFRWAQNN